MDPEPQLLAAAQSARASAAAVPEVRSGSVTAVRMFDVAFEIDLILAEQLWARQASTASRRSRLSMTSPKAIAFDTPPVLLPLEPVLLEVDGVPAAFEATARLYDFGVLVLALRLPTADLDWTAFTARFHAVDQIIGPEVDASVWDRLLGRLCELLGDALIRPGAGGPSEDYLLATVQQWSEPLTAQELQARVDLVPLLSGEQRLLSAGARHELLRQSFSYYEDDLVVLTWDRAFIYEPRGDSDVADVLEVANAQLLELRYYDALLDDELPRMYDMVEQTRRALYLLAPRRFGSLARRLYTLVAEVTELTEKVDNALKVTEDVYLARIYTAALELFRVPKLGSSVGRKLAIIRDTYAALFDEAAGMRGELMELAIVLLIVFEIVLALVSR